MHKTSNYVSIFLSIIFLYFSFFVLAGKLYQGSLPLKKYIKTYPKDSISSLRPYSTPIWVYIEAYLAVPVKSLPSLYGICFPSL